MAAPPKALVLSRKDVAVPADGRLSLRPPLPKALAGAEKIAAIPEFKLEGTWRKLPAVIFTTEKSRGGRTVVRVDLAVPDAAGRTISIAIEGYGVDLRELSSLETPVVAIPDEAVLEFAMGVLEHAWGEGPVEYSVLACDSGACEPIFSERIDPGLEDGRGWLDRRISISELASTRRSFRFEARPLRKDAPVHFPLWANPTIYAPTRRPKDAVNMVLLSIDTLRADHLTSYSYSHDTAPSIDRLLASRGTTFENCVAAATTTAPAHMTIFTSLQPSVHGLLTGMEVLSPTIVTLMELARAHEIETGAITENGWVSVRNGFGRGVNRYLENKSPNILLQEGQVDSMVANARQWLSRNRDRRFLLFLHTYQVHDPYVPPEKYGGLFARSPEGVIDETSPAHLRARADYDREIRYTDDELRSLLETLREFGLDGNTIFVLTSDHGEGFLEHGVLLHGVQLYEEAVRVPLVIAGPGIPANRRIAAPVGQIDVMPTLLDLLGVPVPAGIQGRSLVGLMDGTGDRRDFEERPLFSESWATAAFGKDARMFGVIPPQYSVRVGSKKLVRYRTKTGHRDELYDLASDPHERNDLYADRASEVTDLVALLDHYEAGAKALRRRLAGDQEPPPAAEVELDPAQREKLEALGYVW